MLRSSSIDCSSPMSMNILLNMPAWLRSCIGMSRPHCNMYCSNPTVFRQTDFPPALGPEMMRIRCFSSSSISSGITFFPMFGKRELQQRMYRHCPVYNLLVFKSRFQSGDLLGKQGLGTYEIYFGKKFI